MGGIFQLYFRLYMTCMYLNFFSVHLLFTLITVIGKMGKLV